MILQIQPRFSEFKQWKALAEQQGLCFELLELSAPVVPETDATVQAYRETGLVHSVHGAFIDVNPASGDPEIRQLSRLRCEESCALAEALGASCVVFHCSCFPFLRGGYLTQWAQQCGKYYRELADRYPLTFLIENCMDTDPEPLQRLMEAAACPEVGVCLDVGHANYSRTPITDWFAALQGHIRCLHLSDNRGLFDDHLPLGAGTVDWHSVSELCRHSGTVERVTLEVGGIENTAQSLAYLQKNNLFRQE